MKQNYNAARTGSYYRGFFFRCLIVLPAFCTGIAVVHAQSLDSLRVRTDSLHAAAIADSLAALPDPRLDDPTRYRLIAMPSGRTLKGGEVAIGIHEIVAQTLNWAPVDFFQFSFVLAPLVAFEDAYLWNAGMQVPLYAGEGFVRALNVGVNVGTLWPQHYARHSDPLPSYMVAGAFGTDDVQLHVALNGVVNTDDGNLAPIRPLQLGISVPVARRNILVAETWIGEKRRDEYAPVVWFAGLRTISSEHFVWEIGGLLLPDVTFFSGNRQSIPFPYASASLCF